MVMIFKIETDEIELTSKLIASFKENNYNFMYTDGVIYLNTKKNKSELVDEIKTLSEYNMYFLQEINNSNLHKLSKNTSEWVRTILAKDEFENKIKEYLKLYDNFLDFLEENLENGQFIKPTEEEV